MPNILIGIGGVGSGIVRRVKQKLIENPSTKETVDSTNFFIGIDIDPDYDGDIGNLEMVREFEVVDPLDVIKAREKDDEFQTWWKKGYQISAPLRGLSAGGQVRCGGRLVFYVRFNEVNNLIQTTIDNARNLTASLKDPSPFERRINVFIIGSLGGGTGSGMIIDTAFLTRSHLNATDRIYGVFLDGSVTKRFSESFTSLNAFAALTEIEHWMVNAEQFSMKYYKGGALNAKNFSKQTFFELIYIIQSHTLDNRTFNGSPDEIAKKYKTLAAEFLETFIVSKEFGRTVYANVLNNYDNNIIAKELGRSFNYASFAISHITFPVEKVTDYCTARYIAEELKNCFSIKLPPLDNFESESGIKEWDGNQLTTECRTLDSYGDIRKKIDVCTDSLTDAENPNDFQAEYTGCDLKNFHDWGKRFEAYKNELTIKINSKKKEIQGKLERIVLEAVGSLCIDEISAFLNGFIGKIEKNQEEIEKIKKNSFEKWGIRKTGLYQDADVVIQSRKGIFGFRGNFNEKKDFFINDKFRKWYTSEIDYIEYPLMKEFYKDLLNITNDLLWNVGFIEGIYKNVISRFQREKETYSSHRYLLSPSRQDAGDYVLDMDMSVERTVVDNQIYSKVKERLQGEQIPSYIESGMGETQGIGKIAKNIYEEHTSKDRDKRNEVEASLNNKRSKFCGEINNLFMLTIREKIKNIVSEFRIEQAIDWFLDGCIKELQQAKNDTDKMQALKSRFELIFGPKGIGSLFEGKRSDEEWKKNAASMLLNKMFEITKPFVSVNTHQVETIKDHCKINLPDDVVVIQKVFSHSGFPYKISDVEFLDKPDTHRITFFHQYGFFPLLASPSLKQMGKRYKEYFDSEIDGPLKPIHADARFYTDWRDDILVERSTSETLERMSRLFFLLGFGLDLIKRRRNLFDFYDKENKVTKNIRGLLATLNLLREDEDYRKDFATLVHEMYQDIWIKNDREIKEIWRIFSATNEKIERLSPADNDPIYEEWNKLRKLSKFDSTGKPAKGSIIPKTDADVEDQLQEMQDYKTL